MVYLKDESEAEFLKQNGLAPDDRYLPDVYAYLQNGEYHSEGDMGWFGISMNDSDIYITSGNKKEALKALKKAFRDYTGLQSMKILEDAMADYGYVPEIDDDYNIVGVEHVYQKLGDDEIFWNTLAPYVRNGGFIEMVGEDNTMWRWSFQNGKMTEQTAEIKWRNR